LSLALILVVLSLATFRITRLITRDDFPPVWYVRVWIREARPVKVREFIDSTGQRVGNATYWWLGELVSCPWCASAYVSGTFVGFTWWLHGMPLPIFCWLAVWGASAAVSYFTDK
jgi:hypothetical protein